MLSFKDPIIYEKLINHPDYIIPPKLPSKPTNPNCLDMWDETCKSLLTHSSKHNNSLYKQIWVRLNKE